MTPRVPALLLAAALATTALSACKAPEAASNKAVAPAATPYAAIADGKADVEGGII